MKTNSSPPNRRRDLVLGLVVFALSFGLYVRTLAPSVAFMFDDTLEFQYTVPRLGIIHQTGYPLYTILGKLFTLIVPFRDPAFRLNLFSALNGALAVVMVMLVLRRLTSFRLAAVIGALVFAFGQTFWEQAVSAEIYTMQMLIVAILLYFALAWKDELSRGNVIGAKRRLLLLAFVMGLGLAHHRLIALLYPAIALYVLLVQPNTIRDGKLIVRSAILFLLPLALYAYLPLRGAIGSANGEYENTLSGFWAWVTAQQYTIFLFGNPFHIQRGPGFYATLFTSQFTPTGLALGIVGIVWLLRRAREWMLLALAAVVQALFVFNYRVADVQVHFLTIFMLFALSIGAGADGLLTAFSEQLSRTLKVAAVGATCVLVLLIPASLLVSNYGANDLSNKWDVHDYGLDVLSQPLEQGAAIIGIQGEMTLLRYFQETLGMRPDIQTIAADKEEERLEAIDGSLKQRRVVYLTRPLKGVDTDYALSSLGPLIRVDSPPVERVTNATRGEEFGENVFLVSSKVDSTRLNPVPGQWHSENGRLLRVDLEWLIREKLEYDAMVSLKVLRKDQRIVGQVDHRPVSDAYPTKAWRPGEIIRDSYDVPIFLGAPPGSYSLELTMYVEKTGAIVGHRVLAPIELGPDVVTPRRQVWNIAHDANADFGSFTLAGYSFDAEAPVRPGDRLPLTFLWRAGQNPVLNSLVARIWLEDADGKSVATRDFAPGGGFPVTQWRQDQYVREWPDVRIPANVEDGKYVVKLAAARNNQFLSADWFSLGATVTRLGQVTIKNRPRMMTPPPIQVPFEAVFDKKIRLLGYDLKRDVAQRGVQLTLYWKALALMDTSYTVFIHVLDGANNVILSADGLPGSGEFPTGGWIENEYITDSHGFTLPPDMLDGGYPIEVGWYDPVTGARLKTADGNDNVIFASVNLP